MPPETHLKTLPKQLYGYLRRAFRDLIILGPLFEVAEVCDDALMSTANRQRLIATPVGKVVNVLPEEPGVRTRRRQHARPPTRHIVETDDLADRITSTTQPAEDRHFRPTGVGWT